MKFLLTLLGLFSLVLVLSWYVAKGTTPFPFLKTPTATINGRTFKLTIADSQRKREIGLSQKSSLPEGEGMLFVFDREDYHVFWMRDMKFPIDIIFIKKNRIVTLYPNVQPPKTRDESIPIYKPQEPSDKVLEISASLSDRYGFKRGDEVSLDR